MDRSFTRIVIQYPDPRLSIVSTSFTQDELGDASVLAALLSLSLRVNPRGGVGLAAPQIGVNRRVFVLDSQYLKIAGNGVFINPEIMWKSAVSVDQEGCLSLPEDIWVDVERAQRITVSYINTSGAKTNLSLGGIAARAFMHEFDHLEGLTIARFLSRQVRRKLIQQSEKKGRTSNATQTEAG